MKRLFLICLSLIVITATTTAINVKFIVENMSVTLTEGDVGVFTAFELYLLHLASWATNL